jgi:hypothetical protein
VVRVLVSLNIWLEVRFFFFFGTKEVRFLTHAYEEKSVGRELTLCVPQIPRQRVVFVNVGEYNISILIQYKEES